MLDLQTTWFLLLGVLLLGYAILDGFDLGVGMLHLWLAREERERRVLVNAVGPVWDGNEVWLLTGGGALFAAFPPVYATVFSGLYIPLMLLLTALILRAVSLEFRGKEDSARWRSLWDGAFALGSFLPALLLGVAMGNILRGLPLDAEGEFAGTVLGLLNPFALVVGVLTVALFLMQGAAWLIMKTEGALLERARTSAARAWLAVAVLWVLATGASRLAVPRLWHAFGAWVPWLAPAVVLVALVAFRRSLAQGGARPFLWSSVAIGGLMAVVGLGLYPNLVPSLTPAAPGLDIYGASSSPLTLRTMLVIALAGMPLVLGYTVFIYRSFRGPVRLDEASY